MRITLNTIQKITAGTLGVMLVLGLTVFGHASSAEAAPVTGHQYVADVNHDGEGDAITFDGRTGDWWVAIYHGQSFQTPSRWISGFGIGSANQFLADVTGGGKADLVTFDRTTGDWWVAPSTGTQFAPPARWIAGHGVGSTNQFLADVNGSGKADAVVFIGDGSWFVARSSGDNFGSPSNWFAKGHGVLSTRQFVADVNGDDKADAVVWNAATSDWYVAKSKEDHFDGTPNRWAAGLGIGSSDQFLTDVSGDGKVDAVFAFPLGSSRYGGQWWVANGSHDDFKGANLWSTGFGNGVAKVMFKDVYHSNNADMITFDGNTGDWYVYPAGDEAFINGGVSRWISGFGLGT